MNSKQLVVAAILIVIVGGALVWGYKNAPAASTTNSPRTLVANAAYSCDNAKSISASYFEGPAAPMPAEGQPPTPTGSADVSFDGGAPTTLMQTLSADGARYANADESLVFWSKGNTALVMRNNSMDLTYTNCTTGTPSTSTSSSTTAQ